MTPRRLRILHVVFSLEPGGMENGIVNVARRLPADEFEVHVCCLERGGAFVERLPHPENVVVLGKPPGFSPRAALGVARHAARIGAHVLHPHNLGPLTYAALGSGFGLWKPVLQGEHGVFQGDQASPARLRQRQRLYRACRKVHTVSESLRRYLIERLLYRLSRSRHRKDFVLKGAMLFVLWDGVPHRETRDLDLSLPG